MQRTIDLNADVGEERGDDRALLALVSSANIATGAHAGGGDVLVETVVAAIEAGCALGAHPSYPDREGFGRRRLPQLQAGQALTDTITEQVLLVAQQCAAFGSSLHHVKPHGALYNDAAEDVRVAACVLDGVDHAARMLGLGLVPVVGLAGSLVGTLAKERGMPFIGEAFADRAYDERGRLVPRSIAGSVLDSADEISQRVVDIAVNGRIRTVHGDVIHVSAQTICLHGDTPGAVANASTAREALEGAGIDIARVTVLT